MDFSFQEEDADMSLVLQPLLQIVTAALTAVFSGRTVTLSSVMQGYQQSQKNVAEGRLSDWVKLLGQALPQLHKDPQEKGRKS